jgi:very-short-patch-repair endonuclease
VTLLTSSSITQRAKSGRSAKSRAVRSRAPGRSGSESGTASRSSKLPPGSGSTASRKTRSSEGEETLALILRASKIPFVREYRFHPTRQWRADFALVEHRVLIEVEGGIWSGGRHLRGKGYEADLVKYNQAAIDGWSVLRFSTGQVKSGAAEGTIRAMIAAAMARSIAVPHREAAASAVGQDIHA